MKESIFSTDVCMDKLENQLRIVVDVIRVELPEVKKVTSIRTICDAMALWNAVAVKNRVNVLR